MSSLQVEQVSKKRSSNRNIQYICDKCQKECTKSGLKAKRIQFKELGEGGVVILTRTVSWLCLSCMQADPDYQRPAFSAAPGLRDTRIASG